MRKILLIILSLSIVFFASSCSSKLPYNLSGTASIELHAYNADSPDPFAKIVMDGEDAEIIVEMFNSLKLKELKYTEPSIKGYDFWFNDSNGNQIEKLSLPYGSFPWVVVGGTAYQDVNSGIDLDYLSQLVDLAITTEPAQPSSDDVN